MTSPSSTQRNDIRTCVDVQPLPPTERERLALVKGSLWDPAVKLTCAFLGGDPAVRDRVEHFAHRWEDHMSLRFQFTTDPRRARIRIAFEPGGSWSYIGTQAQRIAPDQPTMNFGWLTPATSDEEYARVVLHEFGHALGCIHEHQNPAGGISWNREAVYAYYAGAPNFWSKEQVDHNLFAVYDASMVRATAVDTKSIMMYPIPKEFVVDAADAVGLNTTLSDQDKQFIRAIYA